MFSKEPKNWSALSAARPSHHKPLLWQLQMGIFLFPLLTLLFPCPISTLQRLNTDSRMGGEGNRLHRASLGGDGGVVCQSIPECWHQNLGFLSQYCVWKPILFIQNWGGKIKLLHDCIFWDPLAHMIRYTLLPPVFPSATRDLHGLKAPLYRANNCKLHWNSATCSCVRAKGYKRIVRLPSRCQLRSSCPHSIPWSWQASSHQVVHRNLASS